MRGKRTKILFFYDFCGHSVVKTLKNRIFMRKAQKRGFDLNHFFVLLSASKWLIYALFDTWCMHGF